MKKIFLIILLGVILITESCSDLKVTSDYDKTADFSLYKTFNIMTYQAGEMEAAPLSMMTVSFIEEAIIDEMMKRGYTLSDDPDIEIYYFVKLNDKTQVSNSSVSVGVGYGSPYYYGYHSGYTSYYNQPIVSNYTEGTLIVELVDNSRDRAIWQGIGSKSVTQQTSKQKEIQLILNKIFYGYKWNAEGATTKDIQQKQSQNLETY